MARASVTVAGRTTIRCVPTRATIVQSGTLVTVADLTIRAGRRSDTDALYDICLRTADNGGDATAQFHYPRLVGDLFAVPYLHLQPELVSVIDDGERAVGYILGTDDTAAFEKARDEQWVPFRRGLYSRDQVTAGSRDDVLIGQLHEPPRQSAEVLATHPGHLHIDLLPQAQGRGLGRALMERFLGALRERGVPGVHLGYGANNTRAGAFYQRLGFQPLWPHISPTLVGRDV